LRAVSAREDASCRRAKAEAGTMKGTKNMKKGQDRVTSEAAPPSRPSCPLW
jgi:hypothetical protein